MNYRFAGDCRRDFVAIGFTLFDKLVNRGGGATSIGPGVLMVLLTGVDEASVLGMAPMTRSFLGPLKFRTTRRCFF